MRGRQKKKKKKKREGLFMSWCPRNFIGEGGLHGPPGARAPSSTPGSPRARWRDGTLACRVDGAFEGASLGFEGAPMRGAQTERGRRPRHERRFGAAHRLDERLVGGNVRTLLRLFAHAGEERDQRRRRSDGGSEVVCAWRVGAYSTHACELGQFGPLCDDDAVESRSPAEMVGVLSPHCL